MNASTNLAAIGYRLPSEEERKAQMIAHHMHNADLYERVGNAEMARQARAAADKLRQS